MTETPPMFSSLVLAGLAGALLGAFFFGGLWWTTRRAAASEQPALWFVSSLVLRLLVVLGGLYAVGDGQPARMLVSVGGFILAQVTATWLGRPGRVRRMLPSEVADVAGSQHAMWGADEGTPAQRSTGTQEAGNAP